MFTACFDAAGSDHDQIALVVAGFLSSARDWAKFDKEWTGRLAQDGIEYFHMVDFAHSTDQFAGWRGREKQRRALLSDLLELVSTYAYRKFGCCVLNQRWKTQMSESNIRRFRENAYCFAASISVAHVDNWALRERIRTPVEVVFEDGDVGKGDFQRRISPRKPDPIFRPKRAIVRSDGVVVPAFAPLQAADMLAYELFQGTKNLESGMIFNPRYPLGHFYHIPGEIGYPSVEDLTDWDGMLRAIAALMP